MCEYWPRGNVIGSFLQEVGTLASGASSSSKPSSTSTPTMPHQTVAAQTAGAIPLFTGAAERRHIGSGAAMVGVLGALIAMA